MTFKDLRNRFSNSQHVQQQTTTHKKINHFGFGMLKNIRKILKQKEIAALIVSLDCLRKME
jgi:hypothetical protein